MPFLIYFLKDTSLGEMVKKYRRLIGSRLALSGYRVIYQALSFILRAACALLPGLPVFTLLCTACGSNENPVAPAADQTRPVEWAAQLEGHWSSVNIFAQGLPVTRYLIPAFRNNAFEARLTGYGTDLLVSVSGDRSGLFSLEAGGAAADTANPGHTALGTQLIWGSFTLGENGRLEVLLRTRDSEVTRAAQAFSGGARLAGDTLLLDFTLAAPPAKRVAFLPDTTAFIARLVKR